MHPDYLGSITPDQLLFALGTVLLLGYWLFEWEERRYK